MKNAKNMLNKTLKCRGLIAPWKVLKIPVYYAKSDEMRARNATRNLNARKMLRIVSTFNLKKRKIFKPSVCMPVLFRNIIFIRQRFFLSRNSIIQNRQTMRMK